ncbi:3-phenylpropionate/trans-cinnamate dioxygenase ferredoxin reductase subunit [Pseudonocardia hierapolitana]|uniref:3-phenylpropionate/trans-cinnamate dioxygenase ferredoxin reductase subunit n=1 Tax=Pseudonocardia hierapolitana TaxID=1128676 RepID=A0A561T222_9PSEU|nr:FAD-dependent oxidoreductase [Pseudonocardia hierapolitana]TWF81157.1 3-phenylpropionate/trans-cinnamate dioxygenase ferredoxin reductase subunit [Pseudonocardia hierapolitana]
MTASATQDDRTFVIVGASLAGAKAAETLREEGFAGRVVLVGEEPEPPYERPPLSKGYLLGSDERSTAFVHDRPWYDKQGIELRTGVRAESLDPGAHSVTLDTGERLAYDKLLLTTGSVIRRLQVPGADLEGVHYLRRIEHSDALRGVLVEGARVVVVGAGWIGLEVAAAARTHGAAVTLVEIDALPLRRVLGDEVAQVFADLHTERGVDLRLGTGVREIVGEGGRVASVTLDDGSSVPADAVVVGVGITPAVELAQAAGLAVDDGVLVDAALRTSDPDVYAAGDVANADNPLLHRRVRVEHWSNALNGGPAAARSMLGQDVGYDRVPYFFTDQYDLGMEYTGHAEPGGYDQVVFRGDVPGREFIAFWLADGRVLAGMNVNIWDVAEDIERIVRSGARIDPARLADPAVPLSDL